MTYLQLAYNGFEGLVPPCIGSLTLLTDVILPFNALSGPLPSSIGSLRRLRVLHISQLQHTHTLPASLANLTALTSFECQACDLTGPVPDFFRNAQIKLAALDLSGNALSGTIPPWLTEIKTLHELDLSANRMIGSIPSSIGLLSNLQLLFLHSNKLNSSIPPSLGLLTRLVHLRLDHNALTGSVPALANCSSLRLFDASFNLLTGSIPATLSALPLRVINLSHNRLRFGFADIPAIPGSLDIAHNGLSWKFTKNSYQTCKPGAPVLEELFVGGNNLTGRLFEVCHCLNNTHPNLSLLDLSENQLVLGANPSCAAGSPLVLRNLNSLNLSRNNLEGEFDGIMHLFATSISISGHCRTYQDHHIHTLDISYNHMPAAGLLQAALQYRPADNATYFDPATGLFCPLLTNIQVPSFRITTDPLWLSYRGCVCPSKGNEILYFNKVQQRCLTCPPNAECDSNAAADTRLFIQPGNFPIDADGKLVVSVQDAPSNITVLKCYTQEACNPNGSPLFECAQGHDPRSLMCFRCESNHFSSASQCVECTTVHCWLLFLLLAVALVIFAFFVVRTKYEPKQSGLVEIMAFWLQLTSILEEFRGRAVPSPLLVTISSAFGLPQLVSFSPWYSHMCRFIA